MVHQAVQLQKQQKRGVGVHGERGPSTPIGESEASPSRPVPKRAHVAKSLMHVLGSGPCSDSVTGRKPESGSSTLDSKESIERANSIRGPQNIESDEDSEMSDQGDDPPPEYQRIMAAIQAASQGNDRVCVSPVKRGMWC